MKAAANPLYVQFQHITQKSSVPGKNYELSNAQDAVVVGLNSNGIRYAFLNVRNDRVLRIPRINSMYGGDLSYNPYYYNGHGGRLFDGNITNSNNKAGIIPKNNDFLKNANSAFGRFSRGKNFNEFMKDHLNGRGTMSDAYTNYDPKKTDVLDAGFDKKAAGAEFKWWGTDYICMGIEEYDYYSYGFLWVYRWFYEDLQLFDARDKGTIHNKVNTEDDIWENGTKFSQNKYKYTLLRPLA